MQRLNTAPMPARTIPFRKNSQMGRSHGSGLSEGGDRTATSADATEAVIGYFEKHLRPRAENWLPKDAGKATAEVDVLRLIEVS